MMKYSKNFISKRLPHSRNSIKIKNNYLKLIQARQHAARLEACRTYIVDIARRLALAAARFARA